MKSLQSLFLISLIMGIAIASEPFPITYDSEATFSKDKSIKNFKYFYIDANGKKTSDKIYNSADVFSHGLAAVKQTKKCSYIDKDENVVLDEVAEWCYEFTDDAIARVKVVNDVWRFIDKKGSFIAQGYEEANDFHEGVAIVKQKGKWGVINTKGEWVVTPSFQELDYKYKQGLLAAKKDGLWGFIDTKGDWVIAPSFEATYGFGENGLSPVKKEGKWGYINTKGEIIIPMQFEMAWQFNKNGWANVRKEGKRIYIDGSGNEVQNKYYQLLKSSKECAEFLSKI